MTYLQRLYYDTALAAAPHALRSLQELVSTSQIVFGSDYPFLKLLVNQEQWVKAFTEIPDSVKERGIEFKGEEIAAIMGGNAARLLGLAE